MADLPFELAAPLAQRLRAAVDIEGKIPRALEVLGPLAGRRVGFVGVPAGPLLERLLATAGPGSLVLPGGEPVALDVADASLDVIVTLWDGFRGIGRGALEEADRALAPGGRLLVVHDYGRDEVSALGDPAAPQYATWSRREGPFLRDGGFKIRVLHCFWTFESLEDARAFLAEAFGERGVAAGEAMRRPRLSWNVAVYHRWRHGVAPAGEGAPAVAAG